MADLTLDDTGKFHNAQEQYVVRDSRYIYFRIVCLARSVVVKTATAKDDNKHYRVYRDLGVLIHFANEVFSKAGFPPTKKLDRSERAYLELEFNGNVLELIVNSRGEQGPLGSLLMEIVDLTVDATEPESEEGDLKDLYRHLAHDEAGGNVYLSDGVFLTRDGDLVEN